MCVAGSLNFAEVVMLDLACATGRAVRLSGPILSSKRANSSVAEFGRMSIYQVPLQLSTVFHLYRNMPTIYSNLGQSIAICRTNYLTHPLSFKLIKNKTNYLLVSINTLIGP